MTIEVKDDRSVKQKVEDAYWRTRTKVIDGVSWIKKNPDKAIKFGAFAVLSVTSLARSGAAVSREARKLHDLHSDKLKVWDPVNGIYYYTKHPMSGAEKLEYTRRVGLGENRADILNDMRLLNKHK